MPLANFLFAYIEKFALVPGHSENWVIIFDLNDVWASEIPRDRIEPMITSLMRNFNARMYRFYAIEVGYMLRTMWAFMQYFINRFT